MDPPDIEALDDVFVVVPSHNHARFVGQCLRSIIGQTHRPKKLLVIDDGSTDGSPRIIEQVLRDCPFECEIIARENRGLCATLNQALGLSDGQFFAYLGSDDVWLPSFLDEQTRLLRARPNAVLAFSHAYLVDDDDNIFDSTAEWTDFADGDLRPLLLRGTVFSSPGVLYRRSTLAKHQWNEAAKLEDYEMYLRLSTEGEFARNREVLCAWRQHGENASDDLPLMVNEMIAAQDRLSSMLGLSDGELSRVQSELKFAAVENLARHGFRSEASRLFLESARKASSPAQAFRNAVRLAAPQTLLQWNCRRKHRKNTVRFGKLADVLKTDR